VFFFAVQECGRFTRLLPSVSLASAPSFFLERNLPFKVAFVTAPDIDLYCFFRPLSSQIVHSLSKILKNRSARDPLSLS